MCMSKCFCYFNGRGGSPHESEGFHIRLLGDLTYWGSHEVFEKKMDTNWMQRLLWGKQSREFSQMMSPRGSKPMPEKLAATYLPIPVTWAISWAGNNLTESKFPCQTHHTLPEPGYLSHGPKSNYNLRAHVLGFVIVESKCLCFICLQESVSVLPLPAKNNALL